MAFFGGSPSSPLGNFLACAGHAQATSRHSAAARRTRSMASALPSRLLSPPPQPGLVHVVLVYVAVRIAAGPLEGKIVAIVPRVTALLLGAVVVGAAEMIVAEREHEVEGGLDRRLLGLDDSAPDSPSAVDDEGEAASGEVIRHQLVAAVGCVVLREGGI